MGDAAAPALDLAGHLSILADGQPLDVEFRGDVVAILLPDLRSARSLWRKLPRTDRRAGMGRLREGLTRSGLGLEVWVGRHRVVRLAAGSRPGRIASWVGLDPAEVGLGALAALFARGFRRDGGGGPSTFQAPSGHPK